jgi:polyisoprenyl-phosphate glycosyltransferase
MKPSPTLALLVPCFNEEPIIVTTVHTLIRVLNFLKASRSISDDSFILFVDDGSTDRTLRILEICAEQFPVRIISLSKNAGHQNALLSGLHYLVNKVDCCISLDADLQDDPSVIGNMIEHFNGGSEIVYGVRSDRSSDLFFKRWTAQLFYKIMSSMGVPLIFNHADFRLLSNRALIELQQYKESNLFLRGIIQLIGMKSSIVEYKRSKRMAGESKYPLNKMMLFAFNGITSFTSFPLKLITGIGIGISLFCLVLSVWVGVVVLKGNNVPGWASITLPLYFLGGIQLLAIGIVGEYISRIFVETKRRPHYHIDRIIEPSDWKEQSSQAFQKDLSVEKW